MKKIIFITVTLMLVCFNYSNSQICATGQNITSCDSFGLDSESSPSGPYYLKLFVWAIRNADGTGGETEQRIQASIEQMKSYFTDENIHFLWDCHINYINSESANTNAIFDEYLKHEDGIDYYFFPTEPNIPGDASANMVGCYSQIRLGGEYFGIPIEYIKSSYVSHEVGYVLGLYHTHADGCSRPIELKDQTNCLIPGDMICSTEADPGYIPNSNTPVCMYDPQNMNAPSSGGPGCELENAAVYTPDLENIMSFFHPGCNTMSFEQEQFQVMRYNLLNHQEISKTVINTNPLFITIDTNFDQYRCSHKDIIVSNNSVLNIKDILTMATGTKIVVERGSKLIVDGGIITGHCGDLWKGIFIEGNPYYVQGTGPDPSGEVVLISATIENAEVGVTTYTTDVFSTYTGGFLSATNSVIKNCDIGVDIGSFGYLGWAIQDDASYIDNCTFENCIIGIKANWNRGVETIRCTFNNAGTAIDLGTSSMLIDDNTFLNSTNFGVYSHHNWPQLDALTLTNNTFATGFTDVILSGPGNILSLDIRNNSFFSRGGLDNYWLTSGDIVNNDFIGNFEGVYVEHVGNNSLYNIGQNFFSGLYYAASNLGNNDMVEYFGNCFENINYYNIEINDNSGINIDQGEGGNTEAGNCFDKTVSSMVTGSNTDFFTYHIKDDTPQADCKHPGSPGNNNWELRTDSDFNFQGDCGSNFTSGIRPSLFNCIVPQDETDQLAFIDSLNNQILSIQADTTLTTYQQNWLTQRLKKCLKKVEGNYVRDRMQETDGKEKVMVFLQTSTDFDLNILAYGLMMNDSDFQNASNYLQSLMTTSSSGQSDFKESQFIYVNHLRTGNPVTQSDMDIIYDNAIERNPYSCFSRSIYYTLTGTRIDLPDIHINSNQPRIQNEAVEEEELYTVYPNPIRDNELYLESSRQVDVVVMDLSGRVIYHNAQLKESVKVVLNDHIDNIYLVRFTDTKGKVTYKKVIRI